MEVLNIVRRQVGTTEVFNQPAQEDITANHVRNRLAKRRLDKPFQVILTVLVRVLVNGTVGKNWEMGLDTESEMGKVADNCVWEQGSENSVTKGNYQASAVSVQENSHSLAAPRKASVWREM